MQFKAACVSALMVVSGGSIAAAGPIAEAGQRAEELQAEGKTLEALDALDAAIETIWAESPLLFRNVTLVEASEGNGGSAERTDRTFRPDETLRVRVEPVGYGYGTSAAGATIGFTGDLSVENATGQVLAEETGLFTLSADSAPDDRHFEMSIGFVVPYIRPGEYVARFTVRDQNSDKSGSFEVPFTVAAPAPEGEAPAAANAATEPDGTAPAAGAAEGETSGASETGAPAN